MVAGKLVFITGASSGIGQALAVQYHGAGYRLALVARRTQLIQDWAISLGLERTRCRVYAADVAVMESILGAARDCMAEQGLPDVVIACAGISVGMDTARREDLDVMAAVYAVNNIGLAATFHPFVEPMVRRGSGILVGIASVNGIRGFPGHGAYCSSKAAVISYCESLRGELRATGVKVLTVCPGYIDTPLTRGNSYAMPFLMAPQEFSRRFIRCVDAGRSYSVIPWQMGLIAKLLRLLPNSCFDRLFASRPRKKRGLSQ